MSEEEYTIKDDKNKCLGCKFYIWIDSGYGYCRRYPPKWENLERWWWKKSQGVIAYQLVGWCRKACGEFVKNVKQAKGQKKG